jgi:hypothetical protein
MRGGALGLSLATDLGNQGFGAGAAPFNGDFASLFPGALQSLQSDRGLTYGGTPLPTTGNTSTTALTLTGSLATKPVPIWWKAENTLAIGAGASFSVYYDGLGVTPAMNGVTPVAATPVPLTGAASGLSATWSAGNSVLNDTWKATGSALADQTANALHYSQASATLQPIVALGLNGFASLLFDGVDDFLQSALDLPAPGTTPTFVWAVYRIISNATGNGAIIASTSLGAAIYSPIGVRSTGQFNGTARNINAGSNGGAWVRTEALFSASAADYVRCGATLAAAGLSAGNSDPAAARFIAGGAGNTPHSVELLAAIHTPYLPSAAVLAAANAAIATQYGGSVVT